MMKDENNVGAIDDIDECDGTLLQFGIIGLCFSSESLNSFSSSDHFYAI